MVFKKLFANFMPEKLISKCAIEDTSVSQLKKLQLGSSNLQNYALQIVVYSKGLPGKRAVASEDAGNISHRTE